MVSTSLQWCRPRGSVTLSSLGCLESLVWIQKDASRLPHVRAARFQAHTSDLPSHDVLDADLEEGPCLLSGYQLQKSRI